MSDASGHQWYWTGVEFRCITCSKPTTDEQALADMREPDDDKATQ